jgi:hypothetical protein
MNVKAVYKWAILGAGITIIVVTASLLPWPVTKSKPECVISSNQSVIRWKDMYYGSCRRMWNGYCIWPPRRPHSTYKVTVHEEPLMSHEKGDVIPVAGGKIREWQVYDAAAWNWIGSQPWQKRRYPEYEPIADNEFVVVVETRYRLFHNVEANLRLCTKKP